MREKFIPLNWAPLVSYMRYALEQQYVMEVRHYADVVALQGVVLAAMVRDNLGFDLSATCPPSGATRPSCLASAWCCGWRRLPP
jgi:hypothetical protein